MRAQPLDLFFFEDRFGFVCRDVEVIYSFCDEAFFAAQIFEAEVPCQTIEPGRKCRPAAKFAELLQCKDVDRLRKICRVVFIAAIEFQADLIDHVERLLELTVIVVF